MLHAFDYKDLSYTKGLSVLSAMPLTGGQSMQSWGEALTRSGMQVPFHAAEVRASR